MPTRDIELPDIGRIKLVKSTRNRNLRLSVTASGVRVSMPQWMPYSAGQAYALKNLTWIKHHTSKVPAERIILSGDRVGRMHTIEFITVASTSTPRSRLTGSKLIIQHHTSEQVDSPSVQKRAHEAARKALKKEADMVLPARLAALAAQYQFTFTNVSTKRLKRRWGSCDTHGHIILNYYLMELPWDCIDYVLLHELTHTIHLNHSAEFWSHLRTIFPRVDDVRKQLREYQPMLRAAE